MRLKTKLAAAITGLVFLVVSGLSWLYISQLLQQHIEQSYLSTDIVAHQLLFTTRQALRKRPEETENSMSTIQQRCGQPSPIRFATMMR